MTSFDGDACIELSTKGVWMRLTPEDAKSVAEALAIVAEEIFLERVTKKLLDNDITPSQFDQDLKTFYSGVADKVVSGHRNAHELAKKRGR